MKKRFEQPALISKGVSFEKEIPRLEFRRPLFVLASHYLEDTSKKKRYEGLRSYFSFSRELVCKSGYPTPQMIENLRSALKTVDFDCVIAIGGGSVLDSAKILEVLLRSEKSLEDLLKGNIPTTPRLPLVAIPTTAGTGSEVTPWATVWVDGKKKSVSHPSMYPTHALLDPSLTLSLDGDQTLETALDALSHAFEAIWNRNACEESDRYASQAIHAITRTLPRVLEDPSDLEGREILQEASLSAGMAMSHTQTALAHSISYPLTAHFGLEHGLAVSFTLPEIFAFVSKLAPERTRIIREALGIATDLETKKFLSEFLRKTGALEKVHKKLRPDQFEEMAPELLDPSRSKNLPFSQNQMNPERALKILDQSFRASP